MSVANFFNLMEQKVRSRTTYFCMFHIRRIISLIFLKTSTYNHACSYISVVFLFCLKRFTQSILQDNSNGNPLLIVHYKVGIVVIGPITLAATIDKGYVLYCPYLQLKTCSVVLII